MEGDGADSEGLPDSGEVVGVRTARALAHELAVDLVPQLDTLQPRHNNRTKQLVVTPSRPVPLHVLADILNEKCMLLFKAWVVIVKSLKV